MHFDSQEKSLDLLNPGHFLSRATSLHCLLFNHSNNLSCKFSFLIHRVSTDVQAASLKFLQVSPYLRYKPTFSPPNNGVARPIFNNSPSVSVRHHFLCFLKT